MAKTSNNSFVKQAAILAFAGLLTRVIGFLYRPFLADKILDGGNGIYGTSYIIYSFFLIVSSAGLPVAISKMVSEKMAIGKFKEAHQVFRVSMAVAIITGLICSSLVWFGAESISNVFNIPRSYYSLKALSPTILIVAIMAVFRGYFQGRGNTIPTALSQIIEQIFNAFFSVFLAYKLVEIYEPINGDFEAMGAAGGTAGTGIGAIAGLLTLLGIYAILKPYISKKMKKDKSTKLSLSNSQVAINIIRLAIPVIAGAAIYSISNVIDLMMVKNRLMAFGNFSTIEADSLFGILNGKFVTITTLPVAISTALSVAIIPSIAKSAANKDYLGVSNKINAALRISMFLAIPCAFGIGILAQPILNAIFPNLPLGKEMLQIGFISIVFLSLAQILTGILQGLGKVKIPVLGAFCGALVKIPLNYFLIANKSINIQGAVISTIFCYVVASLIDWYFLYKITKVKMDLIAVFLKPLASSLVMSLAVYVCYNTLYYLLASNIISLVISIMVGALTYFIFMVLFNGFEEEDLLRLPKGKELVRLIRNFM